MAIRYLILSLTLRCNLRCAYCYNGDGTGKAMDMPETVMKKAFDFVASQEEPFHLQFTGGEPTLVPKAIEKAIFLAKSSGNCRSIGIQTNATALTPELLSLFKTEGIQVGVSLDGPPAVQERQRGKAAETLRGLQMLNAAGVPFRITTVVTQASAATLDKLVLTLAGFNGALGIGLDLLVGKGRATQSPLAIPADPATLEKGMQGMLSTLSAVNRRRANPIHLREQDFIIDQGGKLSTFCHACRGENLAVDPAGRLFPCGQTLGAEEFAAGTLDEPRWENLAKLTAFKPAELDCTECDLDAICPGDCPSRLYYNRNRCDDLVCTMYRSIWNHHTKMTDTTRK